MKFNPDTFARTKILATIGPASNNYNTIKEMVLAGVDGIRLNFSHGDHQFFDEFFIHVDKVRRKENIPLAVLADLQGPKIRIGELAEEGIEIEKGNKIKITTDEIIGTSEKISTSFKDLPQDAEIGDLILIDDGLIRLKIILKSENEVTCDILAGGTLRSRKGMNLPGMKLSTSSLTEKDYEDLNYILDKPVDYIALSFVRKAEDIYKLKDWLKKNNLNKPVIAKIEKKEAVENLDEILDAADGIMVARGDLGVELPPHEVPVLQKTIIRQCNKVGKLVITATQMLESMIHSLVPTRAESSDVANAVWDGTDVVMLSGETAIGKYPVKTVSIMNDILQNAQSYLPGNRNLEFLIPTSFEENLFDSMGRAIADIAKQINAEVIVVFTYHGRTAKIISKYRPGAKIAAISNSFATMNNLCLRWGVLPYFMEKIEKENIAVDNAKQLVLNSGLVKEGDVVIFTAGAPYSEKSRANWLRFEII